MSIAYKRMFWGIIIATFRITVGKITILPSFIAWILVLTGISLLGEYFPKGVLYKLRISAVILIVASFGELIFPFLSVSFESVFLTSLHVLLVIAIEFVVIHNILRISISNFLEMGDLETFNKYIDKDRTYMILMGIAMVFLALSFTFNHNIIGFIGIAMFFITRIYVLTVIWSLSKEGYGIDENIKDLGDRNT